MSELELYILHDLSVKYFGTLDDAADGLICSEFIKLVCLDLHKILKAKER